MAADQDLDEPTQSSLTGSQKVQSGEGPIVVTHPASQCLLVDLSYFH